MVDDARRASAVVGHTRALATPQPNPHCRLSLNVIVSDTMTFMKAVDAAA